MNLHPQVACLRKHWQLKKQKVLRELRKVKITILPTYNIQGIFLFLVCT